MIYFTADLHLYHKKIIELSNRPFSSIEYMNRIIINRINLTLSEKDALYILGDFSLGTAKETISALKSIKNEKHLIIGNHDSLNVEIKSLYKSVNQYKVLKTNNMRFVLFHYPMISWEGQYEGYIHLHGHVHNNSHDDIELLNKVNVGVDVCNFYPVSIDWIMNKIKNRNR